MSTVASLGQRPIQLPVHPAFDRWQAAPAPPASDNAIALMPMVEPAAFAGDQVRLSPEALVSWTSNLGNRTVDVAQKFMQKFAEVLFGDAAKDVSFSFDSLSLSASTSLATSVTYTPDARVNAASIELSQSAHFIGQGQLRTADGQTFAFEIEIRYQANMRAGVAQTEAAPAQQPIAAPDALTLIGKQLPSIEFPGSLADLFKLLGRELHVGADAGGGNSGNLSLRLLRLVNSAALLTPQSSPDDPHITPAERNKALASYAPARASTEVGLA